MRYKYDGKGEGTQKHMRKLLILLHVSKMRIHKDFHAKKNLANQVSENTLQKLVFLI